MTTINDSDVPADSGMVTLTADEALNIGLQLHRTGSLTEAETLYRRTLQAVPQNLNALHFLGLLCHQTGRHEEAAGLIQRITAIDPQNADAHNNLGNALEPLDRYEEAQTCYRRAIEIDPGHAPAHNNLGVILMIGKKMEEAVDACRRATELMPESADFRYNLGNAFRKSGRPEEAISTYREAVALNSRHTGARQALAKIYLQQGRRDEVGALFEEWLCVEPDNPFVLYHKAASLGEDAPSRAPNSYVEQVFDSLAASFDTHLLSRLEYRAPDLLIEALGAALAPPDSSLEILDAGCGTGLCGPLLRPYARVLTGIDLSSRMLIRAADRRIYDNLFKAELADYLGRQMENYDVIASADTLCYFGDLEPVFRAAAGALKPNGVFAFTLEALENGASKYHLNPNCRYAHERTYIEEALGTAGLCVHSFSSVTLRNEGGQPVAGHLVTVRKL